MKVISYVTPLLVMLFLGSLSTANAQNALERGVNAHGGLDVWNEKGALIFTVGNETHTIHLRSRQTLQEGDNFKMGFDGENVWVSPDMDTYGRNPLFHNGLYFYFFAMPFVLMDPGVNVEELGERTVDGKTYNAVMISFDEGVGGSSTDNYVPHFDPESGQLAFMKYTATYRDQEPSTDFNSIAYEEWQEVDGLIVPARATFYAWNEESSTFGDKRGELIFSEVHFDEEEPDPSLFSMPVGAEVATEN